MKEDAVHGLLYLNGHPETYSYALAKGINSGLPILYTNIGAIKERMAAERAYAPPGKYIATTRSDLLKNFDSLIKFVLEYAGKGGSERGRPAFVVNRTSTIIPAFYDHIFSPVNETSIMICAKWGYSYFAKAPRPTAGLNHMLYTLLDFIRLQRWTQFSTIDLRIWLI